MREVWKDIAGYEGVYQVSELGRVKSLDRMVPHKKYGVVKRKGKILQPFVDTYGYLKVRLCNDGVGRNEFVHRLVASAFILNPQHKETVNHINGDKRDNTAKNLEWNTASENLKHAHRTGLISKERRSPKSKPINQYDKAMNLIKTYPSIAAAGRDGFDRRSIYRCCKGIDKTAGGYIWKLA